MQSFDSLFQVRAGRILALSRISQIAIEGLSQLSKDSGSKFQPLFSFMAEHIPAHHQNHPTIDIPEYKVIGFLDGLTLIATISEVEAYFQDVVVDVLRLHPKKMGKSTFELQELLEMGTLQEAIELAIQRHASGLMFKKPNDYKKDLLSIISADGNLLEDAWPGFVEAKARRDLGVHNGWLVNDIYRAKLRDVNLPPPSVEALTVDHSYLYGVRENCIKIMKRLKNHCESTFA
ncbi:hypothetical protein [uncultured Deefgea sp.]|uniref:hypothetical protein n=1 Tax=uncultured Deefgea sp. TaxID=1304914 RepID=UPI0026373BB8|nr:hypothetical protein [uncultured Deefgea sp.]